MKTVMYVDRDCSVIILEGSTDEHNEVYNDKYGDWRNNYGYFIISGFQTYSNIIFKKMHPTGTTTDVLEIALGYPIKTPYHIELKNPQKFAEKLMELYAIERKGNSL